MKRGLLFFLCLAWLFPSKAQAQTGCTLIVSYPNRTIIKEEGDCHQRRSPASSFKIPLALMGFDSGFLKDAHTPAIPYKDAYLSEMDSQKKTTDPQIWLKDSIVWFSQQLTLHLGDDKFKSYIDKFNYGNKDVSGNHGKNDGLTQSWLMSSLLISAHEQVVFIERLLNHDLGVSETAYQNTLAIMPEFAAGGWRVFGKTGSGWLDDSKGGAEKTKAQGWFVGFAEKDGQKIIFAKLIIEDRKANQYGGPIAREQFLALLSDNALKQ